MLQSVVGVVQLTNLDWGAKDSRTIGSWMEREKASQVSCNLNAALRVL